MRTANKAESRAETLSERTESGTLDAGATRRQHARSEVELEVTLESEHNFYLGLTENLSEGGLFIATHTLRPMGSKVTVSLKLPNSPEPINATGTVRWVRQYSETSDTGPGMGVRFEELPPQQVNVIRDFLAARAPLFHDED
ncbi:MAG TPA: TIGR02266 family protein [Polyangiaceae bacterium]|jgi:uncharacterized protein (TIGR02266 family)